MPHENVIIYKLEQVENSVHTSLLLLFRERLPENWWALRYAQKPEVIQWKT